MVSAWDSKSLIAIGSRSNPRPSQIFANSRLISIFSFPLRSAAFCRVLASVCETKLRFCLVKFLTVQVVLFQECFVRFCNFYLFFSVFDLFFFSFASNHSHTSLYLK